jgi:hypothetical protein
MEAPDLEIGEPSGNLSWQRADQLAAAPEDEGAEEPAAVLPSPAEYAVAAETAPIVDPTTPPEVTPQLPEPETPVLPPVADEPRLPAEQLQVRWVFSQPATPDGESPSLLAVVEALNAKQEPVEADGKISLMVMGSDESGGMRRIDRWDFTAEETAASWQTSRLGDGLHLQLPLGEASLPAEPLVLWARLVREDGTKLITSLSFEVDKLTAIEDAAAEVAAADTAEADESAAALSLDAVSSSTEDPASEPLPAPTWRPSAEASVVGPRAEGFGSTVGPAGSGWTTRGGAGQGVAGSGGNSDAAGKGGAPLNAQAPQWRRDAATTR